MKKIFWPMMAIAMIATGVVSSACSREIENLATKDPGPRAEMYEIEKIINATLDSLDYYRNQPVDYIVTSHNGIVTNKISGHIGSSIYFGQDISNTGIESYEYICYNLPEFEAVTINASTIQLVGQAFPAECPLILKNLQQEGALVQFDIEVQGIELGSIEIESPYFQEVSFIDCIGIESKGVVPIVRKIAKDVSRIVFEKAVEWAYDIIFGDTSNANTGQACINAMLESVRECRKAGGLPSYSHGGECPAGCWFSCAPKP